LSAKFEPEKYAPPSPPSPQEIGAKIGEFIGAVLSAPPEMLGAVKGILDRGVAEIRKGPLPR